MNSLVHSIAYRLSFTAYLARITVLIGCMYFSSCGCEDETQTTLLTNNRDSSDNITPQDGPSNPKLSINTTAVEGENPFTVMINDSRTYLPGSLQLKITFIEGYFDDLKGAQKHTKWDMVEHKDRADYFTVSVNMDKQLLKSYDLSVVAGKEKTAKFKIELYYHSELKDTAIINWQQGVKLVLQDVRYDEHSGAVVGIITNIGTKSAHRVKIKCNSQTQGIKWNNSPIDKEVIVDVGEIANGGKAQNFKINQLDFNGKHEANLDFILMYEGGATPPQMYTVVPRDIQLDLKINYDKDQGIVTCTIENKGSSGVKNGKLNYENTQQGNEATLNNTATGNIDIGNFNKQTTKQLPLRFNKAKDATFKFTITCDEAPQLEKNEYFTEPRAALTFFSPGLSSLSAVDLVEIEDIPTEKSRKAIVQISEITVPPNGKVEPEQLEIKISSELPGQQGFLSTSKNGPPITHLVGNDCNLGKEVVLYACPQAGETQLKFKLEAFYKGELIDNKNKMYGLKPHVAVNWSAKKVCLSMTLENSGNITQVSNDKPSIVQINSSSCGLKFILKDKNSPTGLGVLKDIDLSKLKLEITEIPRLDGTIGPGIISAAFKGPKIIKLVGSAWKLLELTNYCYSEVFFSAQANNERTGFKTTIFYNGKQVGESINLLYNGNK